MSITITFEFFLPKIQKSFMEAKYKKYRSKNSGSLPSEKIVRLGVIGVHKTMVRG